LTFLQYTALLRLPDSKYTRSEKLDKVEEIIDVLDLRRAQHTIVGDASKRGLSGGEKKRLSIACELITNPSVLLIDEPTSGLDSCTATTLMQMLKEYASKQQKCVILAVHQPSSKIFHLFDQLLLLSDGNVSFWL
jgi:ABC-type multidrug transport system ATPase subunit